MSLPCFFWTFHLFVFFDVFVVFVLFFHRCKHVGLLVVAFFLVLDCLLVVWYVCFVLKYLLL